MRKKTAMHILHACDGLDIRLRFQLLRVTKPGTNYPLPKLWNIINTPMLIPLKMTRLLALDLMNPIDTYVNTGDIQGGPFSLRPTNNKETTHFKSEYFL